MVTASSRSSWFERKFLKQIYKTDLWLLRLCTRESVKDKNLQLPLTSLWLSVSVRRFPEEMPCSAEDSRKICPHVGKHLPTWNTGGGRELFWFPEAETLLPLSIRSLSNAVLEFTVAPHHPGVLKSLVPGWESQFLYLQYLNTWTQTYYQPLGWHIGNSLLWDSPASVNRKINS